MSLLKSALVLLLFSLPAHSSDWVYTVVDGDNLWDFSTKYLDDVMRFEQLRKLNNIENPKRLQPGSWLRVPMKWIRSNAVPARIDLVGGQVKISRSDGTQQKNLKPGALIHLGDTLKTGQNSSAAIVFADDTRLTLHSDAEMRFDHLSAHGETGMVDSRLHLGRGRLKTIVKPSKGPGSRFEIHTPSAITAVRGTAYRAAVSPNRKSSNIEVLDGDVVVSGADEQTLVSAGFGTRITQGQAPIQPRKLLPSPAINEIPSPLRVMDWQLGWQNIEGSSKYRVEVSDNQQLEVLLWEKVVTDLHVSVPELPDGDYWVRIRGIDSDGLEGNSAVERIVFDRHPLPPQSLSPADGEMLQSGDIELKWDRAAHASGYLMEVATDQAFEDIVVKRDVEDIDHIKLTDITKPGTYFWRVSAKSEDGELGPAGVVRSWHLRSELEPPDVIVTVSDEQVVGSWQQLDPDHRYHVQVAHDADFKHLELDQVTSKNEIAIEHIYSQLRYLRVSAVDVDDYQGPWSSVHKIDPLLGISVWIVPTSLIYGLLFL
ncbi:MAG: FecR domain-containing protein [Candidatus Thiodiazotropha sp. LLP2]